MQAAGQHSRRFVTLKQGEDNCQQGVAECPGCFCMSVLCCSILLMDCCVNFGRKICTTPTARCCDKDFTDIGQPTAKNTAGRRESVTFTQWVDNVWREREKNQLL